MVSAFLIANLAEIICGGAFFGGVYVYGYVKLKGKLKPHKLVYYNISDRVIKGKKMQQRINDMAGGAKKGDTFFK